MSETKYYDVPLPYPTLARGLFTRKISDDSQGKASETYQIVARGYDKFFGIGEITWTTWQSLEAHTAAPYTLSLKSNGHLIMIAALTPSKLVITSKHGIGPSYRGRMSHAEAGEVWLRKYLENKGKTEADLAARLWDSNLTAVAELCDDSYEEQVIAYPPEKTGLHLHGLNVRSKEFKTLSTELVDAFADEWGFIKTPTVVLNSIQEVKDFTNTCAETGKWNGEAIEGFVVRTHIAEPPKSIDGKKVLAIYPYKSGAPFFFKIKFDEPYMMYRDWRDLTTILLCTKGEMDPSKLPNSKMKRPETKVYVKWVIDEIKKDRAPFSEFNGGKGVIAIREKFLEFLKTEQGMKELASVKDGNEKDTPEVATDKLNRTIILPVGVPGCGKTSVSIALAHIFGFGHTGSDVFSNRPAPLIKDVQNHLDKHDVVIADKNNHLKTHRQYILDATSKFSEPVRLIALNWDLDQPPAEIHRICSDRIQQRIDNNPTLSADPLSNYHEDLTWLFISTAQKLTPDEVHNVVEMKLGESLEESVKRAIEGCVAVMGLEMPSDEKIQEGLEIAKKYVPAMRYANQDNKKKRDAAYFGVLVDVNLEELLDPIFANENESGKAFWEIMKTHKRVTSRPRIKIVHKNAIDTEGDLWNRCSALDKMSKATRPLFKGRMTNVIWNGRVMLIAVEEFDVAPKSSESNEGREFVSSLSDDARSGMCIVVGTRRRSIKSMEVGALLKKWSIGQDPDIVKSHKLVNPDLIVYGSVQGLMH